MNQPNLGDQILRWAAYGATLIVTSITAVISYQHAHELVLAHGETGDTAAALPLTVDGLIVTCGLVILQAARRKRSAPWAAWALLAAGILATLAANVAHGWAHGPVGAVIAGWPALVSVGSFEMLQHFVREAAVPVDEDQGDAVPELDDELVEAAVAAFREELDGGKVPGIRRIKSALRIGQPRAVEVQAYLGHLVTA